jgi:hypothetical protein
VLGIGREVAVSSPYTHLGRPIELEISDKGLNNRFMRLTISAYVYDHRYEQAMQSDILRRAKRELLARGVLRPPDKFEN